MKICKSLSMKSYHRLFHLSQKKDSFIHKVVDEEYFSTKIFKDIKSWIHQMRDNLNSIHQITVWKTSFWSIQHVIRCRQEHSKKHTIWPTSSLRRHLLHQLKNMEDSFSIVKNQIAGVDRFRECRINRNCISKSMRDNLKVRLWLSLTKDL